VRRNILLSFTMPFIFREDGITLNIFLDACASFVTTFHNSRRFRRVAQTIVDTLLENRNVHYRSEDHPFHRFGDLERTRRENLDLLSAAVLDRLQDPALRPIVPSFFRRNGSCRDDLDDVIDAFFDFVDETLTDDDEDVGNEDVGNEDEAILVE